jgi:hypothetical protein
VIHCCLEWVSVHHGDLNQTIPSLRYYHKPTRSVNILVKTGKECKNVWTAKPNNKHLGHKSSSGTTHRQLVQVATGPCLTHHLSRRVPLVMYQQCPVINILFTMQCCLLLHQCFPYCSNLLTRWQNPLPRWEHRKADSALPNDLQHNSLLWIMNK